MLLIAALPVVASASVGMGGRRLAPRLSGRTATITITALALVCAVSALAELCAIGGLALAEWAPFAALGHWSPAVVQSRVRLPRTIELGCLGLGATLAVLAAAKLASTVRALRSSFAASRACADELIVLDDGPPEAYALAGLPGRTVVTRSMLRLLSAQERRALLAHERSHVRHHHFVYAAFIELSAAANPLLRPLVAPVRLALERWADADAVAAVTDPQLVARTLARAGLARRDQPDPRRCGVLAAAASDLRQRIEALTGQQSVRSGTALLLALLAGSFFAAASSGLLGLHVHHVIEWAQWMQARGAR